jgi:hypothetical protein
MRLGWQLRSRRMRRKRYHLQQDKSEGSVSLPITSTKHKKWCSGFELKEGHMPLHWEQELEVLLLAGHANSAWI